MRFTWSGIDREYGKYLETELGIDLKCVDRGNEFLQYSKAFTFFEIAEFFNTNVQTVTFAVVEEFGGYERERSIINKRLQRFYRKKGIHPD